MQLAKKTLNPPRRPLPRRSLDRLVREFAKFSIEFTGRGNAEKRNSKIENRQ
jgi:hypothetical protein